MVTRMLLIPSLARMIESPNFRASFNQELWTTDRRRQPINRVTVAIGDQQRAVVSWLDVDRPPWCQASIFRNTASRSSATHFVPFPVSWIFDGFYRHRLGEVGLTHWWVELTSGLSWHDGLPARDWNRIRAKVEPKCPRFWKSACSSASY